MFAVHGTVQLVNLPKDRVTGTPRGFAFVDMATGPELDAAIQALNGSSIGDREIRVQLSQPADKMQKPKKEFSTAGQKLYVGNLPFDITKEEVLEFFGQYGEVIDVFVPKNDEGTGRGFVFITVTTEDAEKVIEATNGVEFEGRTIVVNKPLPPGQKAPPRTYPMRKKIYVGNLSFDTISETIESLFGEFGEVYDCFLPTDIESGNSRGFGFVTMGAEAAEVAILELDGCEVDGRVIRVNAAMEKKDVSYTMKSNEGEYA
jgi:RNA recognition motif-containing protein